MSIQTQSVYEKSVTFLVKKLILCIVKLKVNRLCILYSALKNQRQAFFKRLLSVVSGVGHLKLYDWGRYIHSHFGSPCTFFTHFSKLFLQSV